MMESIKKKNNNQDNEIDYIKTEEHFWDYKCDGCGANITNQVSPDRFKEEGIVKHRGCSNNGNIIFVKNSVDNNYEKYKKEWGNPVLGNFVGYINIINEIKDSINNLINFIDNDYIRKGYNVYKAGKVINGAPGVGKTPLIRAIILDTMRKYPNEVNLVWMDISYIITGNDVGENIDNIGKVFGKVKENVNTHDYKIFFIIMDDFDFLLKDRSKSKGANQESMIYKIMNELDKMPLNVIPFVMTNMRNTDDAIIKRIGSLIMIDFPTLEMRKSMFELHINKLNLLNVDISNLAEITDGFTGHDIEKVCLDVSLQIKLPNETENLFEKFIVSKYSQVEKRKQTYAMSSDDNDEKDTNRNRIIELIRNCNHDGIDRNLISEKLDIKLNNVSRELTKLKTEKLICEKKADNDSRRKKFFIKQEITNYKN